MKIESLQSDKAPPLTLVELDEEDIHFDKVENLQCSKNDELFVVFVLKTSQDSK